MTSFPYPFLSSVSGSKYLTELLRKGPAIVMVNGPLENPSLSLFSMHVLCSEHGVSVMVPHKQVTRGGDLTLQEQAQFRSS